METLLLPSCTQVLDADGVQTIIGILRATSSPSVVRWALGALGAVGLLDEESNQQRYLATGVIDAVLAAMLTHLKSATVQAEGCRAIDMIMAHHGAPARKKFLTDISGVEATLTALRHHGANENVMEQCSQALASSVRSLMCLNG